jgi:hypothetical protein
LLVLADRTPLNIFLHRARLEDLRRLERAGSEVFFMRRGGRVQAEDLRVSGTRGAGGADGGADGALQVRRTPRERLDQMRRDADDTFRKEADAFKQRLLAQTQGAAAAGAGGRGGAASGVVHHIFFTKEQMETRAYGAIFGSRGATHQKLEKETGCKIVLGGRGITDVRKQGGVRAAESAEAAELNPHVMIRAPNEQSLRRAIQEIEWLMSDDPEAVRTREDNKKRAEIDNGIYDPARWQAMQQQRMAATGGAAAGGLGSAAGVAGVGFGATDADALLDELLA